MGKPAVRLRREVIARLWSIQADGVLSQSPVLPCRVPTGTPFLFLLFRFVYLREPVCLELMVGGVEQVGLCSFEQLFRDSGRAGGSTVSPHGVWEGSRWIAVGADPGIFWEWDFGKAGSAWHEMCVANFHDRS